MHDKLEWAQWILERQLAWIASADAKAAALIAGTTAMAAGLVAAYSLPNRAPVDQVTATCAAIGLIVIGGAIICAAMALLPRTKGPASSLIFFGPIARLSAVDYAEQLESAATNALLTDCAEQIHVNATIACDKHRFVRSGLMMSFLSIVPWSVAVINLERASMQVHS